MSLLRRLVSSPARAVALGASVIVAIHTMWLLVFAWEHSHFISDDIQSFWLARTESLGSFLLDPIDEHFVPLHRLVCYLVLRAAPMNFMVALGILATVHVATLVSLWRLLEKLRTSPLNTLLVCLYGLQACLGSQFLWWTAGLGRLTCVLFSVLAAYSYLCFRTKRSRRDLAFTALFTVGALGFYSKGVLVPILLAAMEIALLAASYAERRANALAIGTLFPLIGVYLFVWWMVTTSARHDLNLNPLFHARFAAISLPIFAENCLGFWRDERAAVEITTLGAWATVVGYTISRFRRAWLAWAALLACVALQMSIVALSGTRARAFGLSMARVERYYFDPVFLVPIFGGIAFRSVALGSWERWVVRALSRQWMVAAVVLGVISVLALNSEASCKHIQSTDNDLQATTRVCATFQRCTAGTFYPTHDATRRFMLNIRAGLDGIPARARQPLELIETPLPTYIVPWGGVVSRSSQLLTVMGEHVRVNPDGDYILDSAGHFHDARKWRESWTTSP